MKSLNDYILTLLARGKFFFLKQEAISALGLDQNKFRYQAYRLSKKKAIKRLLGDFYMIISPEYYHLGSLPPNWIVGPLMQYLEREYYIGLLSAAAFYGATEQQPMVLQVITDKMMKSITLERSSIEFHVSKHCSLAAKTSMKVATGYVNVSTKEQTIVDLVKFYKVAGYLSNAAVVIKVLAEECDFVLFDQIIKIESNESALQRLGYILEIMALHGLAQIIENRLLERKIEYVSLRPDYHIKEGPRSSRWKIIINDSLEVA
ncbi:hypothetical protein H0X48_06340 [Candidatus Dependentiae bacterium]|nr:hypothetical protein [Candidatus Dependentiae bacterium]